MRQSSASGISTSLRMTSLLALAAGIGGGAYGLNVASPNITGISAQSLTQGPFQFCRINGAFSYTANTTDGTAGGGQPIDYSHLVVTDQAGNPIPTTLGSGFNPLGFVNPSTSTGTFPVELNVAPGSVTGDLYLTLFEATGTLAADRGAQLAQGIIPASALQSAGGECANFLPNAPPTVNAGPDDAVAGGDSVSLSGTASDPNNDPLTYAWTQTAGPTVTLSGATTLAPSFTAPAKTNSAQILTFSLVANDGLVNSAPDTVDITVAANQAPVANAGPDGSTSGGFVGLGGGGSNDPDGDPITYLWTQLSGPTATITNGTTATPSITVPPKSNVAQDMVFQLVVNDGLANSTPDTATVTILANVGPTANAGPDATIAAGATASLDGTGSTDGDGDQITYQWTQVSGPTVSLNASTIASPTFTAPAGQATAQTLVFSLVVDDGLQTSAADTVTLTIPANTAPVAVAGSTPAPGNIASGVTVNLDASGSSDPDGDPITYNWTQVGGSFAVNILNPTAAATSFTAPVKGAADQTVSIAFQAYDGVAFSNQVTLDYVVPANIGPTANAGADALIAPGASIALDGSASSDGDGDALTYAWSQVSGPSVSLTGANTANASFTAPPATTANQTLGFQLTVDDGFGGAATDIVEFTIGPNATPTVNAGPDQTVSGSSAVTLAGSATDPENDAVTVQWTQTAGPSVTLSDATALAPTFTAPPRTSTAQTLTFSLVGNDGTSNSSPDTVDIIVAANQAPVAAAGADQSVAGGDLVALSGAITDPDNDPVTAQWVQTAGPTVTLSDATALAPTFTAPPKTSTDQTLTFSLVGNDGTSNSAPDTVDITVVANQAPVATAGADQSVSGGELVALSGSITDPDNDPVTAQWTQTAGPTVTLSDATALTPTFTAPPKTSSDQTLTFALVGSDGVANSAPDTIDIVVAANQGPTASAGADQTVSGGATITLDASASSDPDGDTLAYTWTQVSGAAVTLTNSTSAIATFVAPPGQPTAETLVFEVSVSDGQTGAVVSTDTVSVTIEPNNIPLANAGADIGPVDSGMLVTLDGTASSDPDGDAITYQWTQLAGPQVTLSDPTSSMPTFTAPGVSGLQDLVFQLIVNDGTASSEADGVTVSVQAIGEVRIVQEVAGADRSFQFLSNLPALNTTLTTVGGVGELVATGVAAGQYTIRLEDLTADGYAVSSITCNDADSTVDLANQSITLQISPNESLSCVFSAADTRTAAGEAIGEFLTARNAALLASQPSLQRRLDRVDGVASASGSANLFGFSVPGARHLPLALSFAGQEGTARMSLADMRAGEGADRLSRFDVWGELSVSKLGYDGHDGLFSVAYLGADYLLDSRALVGVLAQADSFNLDSGASPGAAEGDGWMAGPYFTAKLAPQLYVDARAAWGTSDNSVSPLGGVSDAFDTSRALYSTSLIGRFDIDNDLTLRPELTLRYFREDQGAYIDRWGVSVPGNVYDQGEVRLAPRVERRFEFDNGWVARPYLGADLIYSFGLPDSSRSLEDLRGRLEAGGALNRPGKIGFNFSGFLDGIGDSQFSNYGLTITLTSGF